MMSGTTTPDRTVERASADTQPSRGIRVLVAEDEENLAQILCTFLRGRGHHVVSRRRRQGGASGAARRNLRRRAARHRDAGDGRARDAEAAACRARAAGGHHHHRQRHARDRDHRDEARRLRLHGEAVSHGRDRRARAPRVGEASARAREPISAGASLARRRDARGHHAVRADARRAVAARAGRDDRFTGADHRRIGDGQDAARARDSSPVRPRRPDGRGATARCSPRTCWTSSCSATSAARSAAPSRARRG